MALNCGGLAVAGALLLLAVLLLYGVLSLVGVAVLAVGNDGCANACASQNLLYPAIPMYDLYVPGCLRAG